MKYFGLYFSFFCTLFAYIHRPDGIFALAYGATALFWYFVAISLMLVGLCCFFVLFIRKSIGTSIVFPFLLSLFGSVGFPFFLRFITNRVVLLVGSYMLMFSLSMPQIDWFFCAFGGVLLLFGYTVLNPFHFDFTLKAKQQPFHETYKTYDDDVIDVTVIDELPSTKK